jgi:hypothetical protein
MLGKTQKLAKLSWPRPASNVLNYVFYLDNIVEKLASFQGTCHKSREMSPNVVHNSLMFYGKNNLYMKKIIMQIGGKLICS